MKKATKVKKTKSDSLEFKVGVVETAYKVLKDRCDLVEGRIDKLNVDHGSIHPDRISLLVFKSAKPYIWAYLLVQVVFSIVLLIAILK